MSAALIVVCPHCAAPNRVAAARLGDKANCGKCKVPLFDGHPLELNAGNFDAHTRRSDLPVVVDFWAPWCAPCRSMAPAFEQATRELEPQVRLAKLNTESEPQLAERFGIRSIPTLALFKDGREIARQAGAMDAGNLLRWIRSHI